MKLPSYLIGEDTLVIQCAEIILKRGHDLLGVFSCSNEVQQWCRKKSVPYFQNQRSFLKQLEKNPCDYLFSIVNSKIINEKILQFVRRLAINYHDSLLPKYAGVHVTSWAILNAEASHGITWHVIEKKIDSGDILKQVSFPIATNETALSLNLKCYEAAISSFSTLIEEIEQDRCIRTLQNLTLRSYYGLYKKPPAYGIIDWHAPAAEIDRLVRALDMGSYTNKLALPKLLFNRQIVIIKQLQVLSGSSNKTPGTILKINKQGIVVVTSTNNVLISKIQTLDKERWDADTWCKQSKINSSEQFISLNKESQNSIEELSSILAKNEPYWIEQFLSINPKTSIGFLSYDGKKCFDGKFVCVEKFTLNKVNFLKLEDLMKRSIKTAYIFLTLWMIVTVRRTTLFT